MNRVSAVENTPQTPASLHKVAGSWKLLAWKRIEEDGLTTYPLGEDAEGLLIYTADGKMAVQITAAHRPLFDTGDALGGSVHERAAAYSTCLAYFGSYELEADTIVHHVDASLYPNWSATVQSRPFTCDGKTLVLRTPPSRQKGETVVNEISWTRQEA